MSLITVRTRGATGTKAKTLDPADIPLDLLRQVFVLAYGAVLEVSADAAAAGGDSEADCALAELGALCDEAMRRFGRPTRAPCALPGQPPTGPLVLH